MTVSGFKPYAYIVRMQELIKLMGLQTITFLYCYPVHPRDPYGEMNYKIEIGDISEYNRLQEFLVEREIKSISKFTKLIRKILRRIK